MTTTTRPPHHGVGGPDARAPRRRARPPAGSRRMRTAVGLVLAVAIGIGALSWAGSTRHPTTRSASRSAPPPLASAPGAARAFLDRYVATDGRVVRHDQGGDTVSEGQGYALLLSVVADDPRQFARVWAWEQANLQLPDGLFSFHWAKGEVVGRDPATDADLDTAWALVLGARRFHQPAYETAGLHVASAILDNETVTVAGRIELVAGPWARTDPYTVDPSYLAPEAMAALGSATGDRRWRALETDSVALIRQLSSAGGTPRLVSDWASLTSTGTIAPSPAPSSKAAPAYGQDAERVPVWYAADCTASGRELSAAAWPILSKVADGGGELSYGLSGSAQTTTVNPLGWVAAAAAAAAAGHRRPSVALLARAAHQSATFHTYYGDAWVALGRALLETRTLSSCPPSA